MLTRRRARSERRWNGCSPTRLSATPQPQPPAESPRTSPTAPPSRPSSRSRPRPADRRRSLLLHPQPVSRSVASGVRGSPRADRDSAPAPRRGGLDRAHRRRRCLGDATLRPVVRVLLDPRIFGLRGEPAHAEALRLGGAGPARRRALVAGTRHHAGRRRRQGGRRGGGRRQGVPRRLVVRDAQRHVRLARPSHDGGDDLPAREHDLLELPADRRGTGGAQGGDAGRRDEPSHRTRRHLRVAGWRERTERPHRGAHRRPGRTHHPPLRLRHASGCGDAAGDGGGVDPDDVRVRARADVRHQRLDHRPVPRSARRTRRRDRLRASDDVPLPRGARGRSFVRRRARGDDGARGALRDHLRLDGGDRPPQHDHPAAAVHPLHRPRRHARSCDLCACLDHAAPRTVLAARRKDQPPAPDAAALRQAARRRDGLLGPLGTPGDEAAVVDADAGRAAIPAAGLPAGVYLPYVILVENGATPEALAKTATAVGSAKGVAGAAAPPSWRKGTTGLVEAFGTDDGSSRPAKTTISDLRDDVLPAVRSELGGSTRVTLGGAAPESRDFIKAVYGKFPYLLLFVLILTFVLLMRAFRSIVLPVKAVILNLLSLGAAYGIIVFIFQDGHGSEAIWNVQATDAIISWIPLMVFAFLYGISMDYEVFMLTRMREAYEETGDTRKAIELGLARTGKLVTSAALVLMFAFFTLSTGPGPDIKQFGIGLSAGIIFDATVIRALLVPSVMQLLGRWNWWLPAWTARVLRTRPSPLEPARSET